MSHQVMADSSSVLVGKWEFYKVYFEGEYREPFSKNLKIFFEFNEEGESRLYYYRTHEKGFCERQGEYRIEENFLVDKVTWLNPENNSECGLDPDMRLGNETTTPFEIKEGEFYLHLFLSGQPLVYIWKRISP